MAAEREKIDLSTYNGPMTVVGYPDFSVIRRPSLPTQSHTDELLVVGEGLRSHEHKKQHHKTGHK